MNGFTFAHWRVFSNIFVDRKLVATGFHPTFRIHHDNQLNAFNLADDLIEPYRAIVHLVAHNNIASNIQLTKSERRELPHVLHNACSVDGVKMNVMSAIDIIVESLKRIILDSCQTYEQNPYWNGEKSPYQNYDQSPYQNQNENSNENL